MDELDTSGTGEGPGTDELPITASDDATAAFESDAEASTVPTGGARWWRVLKRVAVGLWIAALALALLAALLYSYGGMERPKPEYRTAYAALVARGVVAPTAGRFTIPIPGCRCHSDDPVQQIQHSTYRLRECRACH